jgi:small subunit ribosomal protein S1
MERGARACRGRGEDWVYNMPMQVLIAKHSGFCEGVERAYRIAINETKKGATVYMLGNLVHNTQVVEKLKAEGIKTVKDLSEIPAGQKGILLISAHGVVPQIYDKAKDLGLTIVDTTCPWVKKAQKIAKELADKDCWVIIIGDKGHAEVKGIVGWGGGKAIVLESPEEAASANIPQGKCVGILAQTTQSKENFDKVVAEIRKKNREVKVHETICGATSKRQDAAIEIAKQVGLMLVVGDKMSANTKRLTELCLKTGTETHQIQSAQEFDKDWLKGKEKVGITAGASTPEWVVREVINLFPAR